MSIESRTEQLQIGEWLAEPALDRLSRRGEIVKLEPRTMRLLVRLCEAPGRVMSSRQLLDEVWSGVVVGPSSVYQAVSQLRRQLADTDPVPTYIATVPRKGYRLIAPVRRIATSGDQEAPQRISAPADAAAGVSSAAGTVASPIGPASDPAVVVASTASAVSSSTAAASSSAGIASSPRGPVASSAVVVGNPAGAVRSPAAAGTVASPLDQASSPAVVVARPAGPVSSSLGPASSSAVVISDPAGAAVRHSRATGNERRSASVMRRHWRAIATIALAAVAGVVASVLLLRGELGGARPVTVAVLPFTDMSADQRDGAFCDGLTQELSASLSQLPALRVVARTSAFAFRGQNIDVREIGRRLAATHVIEGSVRRSGDAIRVTAQLIDARRGYESWSESYNLRSKDVLRLQGDIARSVAAALEIRFPAASSMRLAARGSGDAAAYELYLLGRHYYRQRTPESNARAADINARAIELDRNFAPAYVGLAQARLNELALSGTPVHELAGEVGRLLDTALRLNPELSDAYAARGALRRELNQLDAAKKDLARAVVLDPNNVQAIVSLGRVFEYEGQPRRALQSYTEARLLDPLDFMRHVDRCVVLQDLGRYREAAGACAEARNLQPQSEWSYMAASWLARAQGRQAQALYWNGQALRVAPDNAELYLQRIDDLLNLGILDEAKAALQRAQHARGAQAAASIRHADVLLIEAGPAAARDHLARLDPGEHPSAFDLLMAVQISLSAGDRQLAAQFARQARAAPDFSAVELAHRTAIKWGVSSQLPFALLELHQGDRASGVARMRRLLATLDELERNGYVSWGIHSLRADALALLGDADGAMRSLRAAVRAGWRSAWSAQRDPYLSGLFGRADFQALMREVERLNAAERGRYLAQRLTLARG